MSATLLIELNRFRIANGIFDVPWVSLQFDDHKPKLNPFIALTFRGKLFVCFVLFEAAGVRIGHNATVLET